MTLIALGLLIVAAATFAGSLINVLTRIAEGIEKMADLEAASIAALKAAADAIVAKAKDLAAQLAAAQAAAGQPPVDHSADIDAIAKELSDAIAPAAPSA